MVARGFVAFTNVVSLLPHISLGLPSRDNVLRFLIQKYRVLGIWDQVSKFLDFGGSGVKLLIFLFLILGHKKPPISGQ